MVRLWWLTPQVSDRRGDTRKRRKRSALAASIERSSGARFASTGVVRQRDLILLSVAVSRRSPSQRPPIGMQPSPRRPRNRRQALAARRRKSRKSILTTRLFAAPRRSSLPSPLRVHIFSRHDCVPEHAAGGRREGTRQSEVHAHSAVHCRTQQVSGRRGKEPERSKAIRTGCQHRRRSGAAVRLDRVGSTGCGPVPTTSHEATKS